MSKVLDHDSPGANVGDAQPPSGAGSTPEVMSWSMFPTFVHLTVSPALITSVPGLMAYSSVVTVWVTEGLVVVVVVGG